MSDSSGIWMAGANASCTLLAGGCHRTSQGKATTNINMAAPTPTRQRYSFRLGAIFAFTDTTSTIRGILRTTGMDEGVHRFLFCVACPESSKGVRLRKIGSVATPFDDSGRATQPV